MQVVIHILTQEVRIFSQKNHRLRNLLFFNLIAIRGKSYVGPYTCQKNGRPPRSIIDHNIFLCFDPPSIDIYSNYVGLTRNGN